MPKKIWIELINRDLVRRFGKYLELPYNEAIGYVNKGNAIFKEDKKKTQEQEKAFVSTIELMPEHINTNKDNLQKGKKYPEILWLQDTEKVGGSELSSMQTIRVGRKLGFDIGIMTPLNFSWESLHKAKLLILNNIWFFDNSQMGLLKRVMFEYQIPYVKYEHDSRHIQDDGRIEFARRLFLHSRCNFFISPAHLKFHQKYIFQMSPSHAIPLAVDADIFKLNNKIKRIKNSVVNAAGKLHSNKGLMPVLSFASSFPDYQITIYTDTYSGLVQLFKNLANVTLRPKVKNEELPDIYNAFEYLVHLPVTFGAGERVILEAALCGCKIISNEMSGHMSWDWMGKNPDMDLVKRKVTKAPYEFWKIIAKIIK